MHIPDGYLGPATYGSLWAAMVPIWLYASRKVKEKFRVSQVPFLATASAFSLVVMLFAVPLPGGTSGHITGSALVAMLLGPWAGILSVSTALAIQAVVFGDGGITAIGANCFNMAFIGSLTGYGAYRLFAAVGKRVFGRKTANGFPHQAIFTWSLIGAGTGAYASVNLGALLTAVELGIQPVIQPEGGYFPFPLHVTIPAVMLPHLTVVGSLEAIVTVLILLALHKLYPDMTKSWKSAVVISFLMILSPATPLSAHDFWIERQEQEFTVVFGHGRQREEFDPSKIKNVKAFDRQGKAVGVSVEKKKKGVMLKPSESPSMIVAEIDNGYWSKTIYGWKNLPKRKASRVVEAVRSMNYSKVILSWGEITRSPIEGIALDIVPMENIFLLKAGDRLPLKILYQGKPLAGIDIIGGEHDKVATTNPEGVAIVYLSKGHQLFTVTYKEVLKDDPDADLLSITSTLTFEVTR